MLTKTCNYGVPCHGKKYPAVSGQLAEIEFWRSVPCKIEHICTVISRNGGLVGRLHIWSYLHGLCLKSQNFEHLMDPMDMSSSNKLSSSLISSSVKISVASCFSTTNLVEISSEQTLPGREISMRLPSSSSSSSLEQTSGPQLLLLELMKFGSKVPLSINSSLLSPPAGKLSDSSLNLTIWEALPSPSDSATCWVCCWKCLSTIPMWWSARFSCRAALWSTAFFFFRKDATKKTAESARSGILTGRGRKPELVKPAKTKEATITLMLNFDVLTGRRAQICFSASFLILEEKEKRKQRWIIMWGLYWHLQKESSKNNVISTCFRLKGTDRLCRWAESLKW